jgi:soluble lytic murein transglycosylase-like protein
MGRILLVLAAAMLCSPALAGAARDAIDALIVAYAVREAVPVTLVRKVVEHESRYNAAAVHAGCYGLMQITYETARRMGYRGSPAGLLEPAVNLKFAIPYLARAYGLAKGNQARAIMLYQTGF